MITSNVVYHSCLRRNVTLYLKLLFLYIRWNFKILRNEMQTKSEEISIDTLKNASMLVESLDDQKHYFKAVINDFCFTVLRDIICLKKDFFQIHLRNLKAYGVKQMIVNLKVTITSREINFRELRNTQRFSYVSKKRGLVMQGWWSDGRFEFLRLPNNTSDKVGNRTSTAHQPFSQAPSVYTCTTNSFGKPTLREEIIAEEIHV